MTFIAKLFFLFFVTALSGRLVRFLLSRSQEDNGMGIHILYTFLGYAGGFILGMIILGFFF